MAEEAAEATQAPTLKAFYDGDVIIIAESVQEAIQILSGSPFGIPAEEQTPEEEWQEVPDVAEFTIEDDNGNPPVKKSIVEWIKSNGKGYLCSESF